MMWRRKARRSTEETIQGSVRRQATSASAVTAMKSPSATSGSRRPTEILPKLGGFSMGMTRTGRTARSSRLRARVAWSNHAQPQTLGHRRIGRGVAKVQLSFFTDLTPSLQGDGHGVHHLDRAAVCFAGVVVRGHGFILGQAAVGKAPRSCRHRGGPHPENRGRHVHPRERSLDECITLAGTPPAFGANQQQVDLSTDG